MHDVPPHFPPAHAALFPPGASNRPMTFYRMFPLFIASFEHVSRDVRPLKNSGSKNRVAELAPVAVPQHALHHAACRVVAAPKADRDEGSGWLPVNTALILRSWLGGSAHWLCSNKRGSCVQPDSFTTAALRCDSDVCCFFSPRYSCYLSLTPSIDLRGRFCWPRVHQRPTSRSASVSSVRVPLTSLCSSSYLEASMLIDALDYACTRIPCCSPMTNKCIHKRA